MILELKGNSGIIRPGPYIYMFCKWCILVKSFGIESSYKAASWSLDSSPTTKVTSTESACVCWGTGELLVQDLLGPDYTVWNGSCRGAGSPPEHCQGALEQITALLIGPRLLIRGSPSPLMHVCGSCLCMCAYSGPVDVKVILQLYNFSNPNPNPEEKKKFSAKGLIKYIFFFCQWQAMVVILSVW